MKLIVRSLLLLLGGGAALHAVPARAADLAAAEPVEYVRVCDAFGAGYFFIPGSSDTCLRISGYVRAYFQYQGRNTVNNQTPVAPAGGSGIGRQGGFAEIVTPVLANPVRANGTIASGTVIGGGTGSTTIAAGAANAANNYALYGITNPALLASLPANSIVRGDAELRDQYASGVRALLRFDARTKTEFGILRSFFEFAANTNNVARNGDSLQVRYGFVQFGPITAGITNSFFNTDVFEGTHFNIAGDRSTRPPLLAYTASLGSGWSVSLSAEDASVTGGAGGANTVLINGGTSAWVRRAVQIPDGVANIRVSQEWGYAQIAGAVSQFRFANTACTSLVAVGGACTANKVGWAVNGTVNLRLPFIAKGDNVTVKATYAEGALNYLGFVTNRGFFGNGAAGVDNTVTTTTGFSLFASFSHFWTPAVRTAVSGNYITLGGRPGGGFGSDIALFRDGWTIGGLIGWSPVRNFEVSLHAYYQEANYAFFGTTPAFGVRQLGRASDNNWAGSVRVQRTF